MKLGSGDSATARTGARTGTTKGINIPAERCANKRESGATFYSVAEHSRRRREFFRSFGHLWPDTLTDEFDILEPHSLSVSEIEGILSAAAAIRDIYACVLPMIRTLSSQAIADLGVPPHLIDLAIGDTTQFSEVPLQRLDFGLNQGRYSLLELNSDVPGLVVEAFSLNGYACQHAGLANPNASSEDLLREAMIQSIERGLSRIARQRHGNLVFATHSHCKRDAAISRYLASLLSGRAHHRVQNVDISELEVNSDGVYDANGQAVDVLHRMTSLRFFQGSVFGRSGRSANRGGDRMSGQVIYDLVRSGRLALINSPVALLLESKAIQVIIWGLHERGLFFTPDQHDLVHKYMLPCYLDQPSGCYAAKSAYGAEGEGVAIVNSFKECVQKSEVFSFDDGPTVYQKYIDLPERTLMTEYGPRNLTLIPSCFLVAGKPTAICMRAGAPITDSNAWVVPVGTA